MVIGLTGGIASGKSTVAAMLRKANIPVIDADQLARDLTQKQTPALKQIALCFGNEILNADGSLNRSKLAKIVFSDPNKLKELEGILHPMIEALRLKQLAELKKNNNEVVVYMAPLIFENGIQNKLDKTLLITADQELVIKRIKERDGLDTKDAQSRIQAQMNDEEKKALADAVIENNGSLADLLEKLVKAFKELCGIDLLRGRVISYIA